MDIFEFAMRKEQDAEKLYRDLASRVGDGGRKTILTRLADAERKHAEVVAALREETGGDLPADFPEEPGKLLEKLAEDRSQVVVESERHVDVYRKARDMEQESVELYREQSEKAGNPLHQRIFRQLMEQEKMHYILLDNMLDFVMMPESWCEDAEFSHIIDKYRGTAYYPGLSEYEA